MNIAISNFLEESKKKHSNRGIASGIPNGQKTARHITKTGQNEGNYIASNISGYFDRPLREHRGILGTIKACRTTAFTLNNQELWNSVDSRILAIQYHSDGLKQIEYKNPREDVVITDISILQKYIDRFNLTEQTYQAQLTWDKNRVKGETSEQKVTRLGPRP